jgi:hypothetical protein
MYPKSKEDFLGDASSALFNSAYALGAFLGPLVTLYKLETIYLTFIYL